MGLFSKKHDETVVDPTHNNTHGHTGHSTGTAGLTDTNYNNNGGLPGNHNTHGANTGITHGQHGTGVTGNSHTHGAGTGAGLTGTGAGLSGSRTVDVDPAYGNTGHGGMGHSNVMGHNNNHNVGDFNDNGLGRSGNNTDPLGHSNIAGHNGLAGHNNNSLGHNNGLGHTTGGIPPSSNVNHNATHGGGGKSMTGKIETAVGSMIGSQSLKAKGLQKEQEAQAIKMQGHELAEAERLEQEALMRRERAVAHGAHPANGHPTGVSGVVGGDRHHGGVDPTRNTVGGSHMSS